MSKQHVINVEGWTHDSIQGVTPRMPNHAPKHIVLPPNIAPVVISAEQIANLSDERDKSEHRLYQISPDHQRSFELNSSARMRTMGRLALWNDEFGNQYTSHSLKGNNFSHADIFTSSTAPSGYMAYGLLESDALLRVIRASDTLRKSGVATEWINRVFEPKEMIYGNELVSRSEYKSRLIESLYKKYGSQTASHIEAALESLSFFITSRSMEINDRPKDLTHGRRHDIHKRLSYVFKVYNELHRADDDFAPLSVERENDIIRYLTKVLPSLTGANLARMHNSGLAHHFPVSGNITALGGFIDLDSVTGAPLGLEDNPITSDDVLEDVYQLVNFFDGCMPTIARDVGGKLLPQDKNLSLYGVQAIDEFIASYNKHRYDEVDPQDKIKRERIIEVVSFQITDFNNELLQEIAHGWDSQANELLDRLKTDYTHALMRRTLDSYLLQNRESLKNSPRESIDHDIHELLQDIASGVFKFYDDELVRETLYQHMQNDPTLQEMLDTITHKPEIRNNILRCYSEYALFQVFKGLVPATDVISVEDALEFAADAELRRFSEVLDIKQQLTPIDLPFPSENRNESVYNMHHIELHYTVSLKTLIESLSTDQYKLTKRSLQSLAQHEITFAGGDTAIVYDILHDLPRLRAIISDEGFTLHPADLHTKLQSDTALGVWKNEHTHAHNIQREYFAFIQEPERYGGPYQVTIFL